MKARLVLLIRVLCIVVFLSYLASGNKVAAQTGCATTPSSSNSVVMTISVPESNTYTVWTRLRAVSSTNNSVWVQIDNGCAVNVGDSTSIPANTFAWVNYQNGSSSSLLRAQLSAGSHIVKVIEREPGVGVDKIILTTNTTCVPTGTGTGCEIVPTNTPAPAIATPTPTRAPIPTPTPTMTTVVPTATRVPTPTTAAPTPTRIPTPTSTLDTTKPAISIAAPVAGSIIDRGSTATITAIASDNRAVREVRFTVVGKTVNISCTDTTAPYTCNWSIPGKPDVTYTITATAYDTSSNMTATSIQAKTAK